MREEVEDFETAPVLGREAGPFPAKETWEDVVRYFKVGDAESVKLALTRIGKSNLAYTVRGVELERAERGRPAKVMLEIEQPGFGSGKLVHFIQHSVTFDLNDDSEHDGKIFQVWCMGQGLSLFLGSIAALLRTALGETSMLGALDVGAREIQSGIFTVYWKQKIAETKSTRPAVGSKEEVHR